MTTTINASNSGSGGLVQTADASGILALQTAGTTAVTIDTSQNVGIGTTGPSALGLQVTKGSGVQAGVAITNPASSWAIRCGASVNYLDFTDQAAGERMRIDSGGNVGIGTTSPSSYGNFVVNASGTAKIIARESSTGNQTILYSDGGAGFVGSVSNIPVLLLTNNTERMRITSAGNVQIGTTSISAGRLNVLAAAGASGIVVQVTNNGDYGLAFNNASGTNVGRIQIDSGSTSYVTSSDYRLKNSIAPMTGALAKVALLKPCTYKWNEDSSDAEGFIAHELAEVCPQAVSGAKDEVDADGNPRYQGIDTSFLVATLTAAIQEQQALITSLTARIAALEGIPA